MHGAAVLSGQIRPCLIRYLMSRPPASTLTSKSPQIRGLSTEADLAHAAVGFPQKSNRLA